MLFNRILFLVFLIIQGCQSLENLFNISLAIANTRTVLACGSSIIIYFSFNSKEIVRCPYVTIEKNIQLINMKITIEDEMKVNLTSQSFPSPKAMIKLKNNTLISSTNITQLNAYYLSFSSELMCRYSFIDNITICFYYPSSINFFDIEDDFDRITNAYLHLPNQTRRRYTFILIILGILVLVVCLIALYLLCSSQLPYHHRIELDHMIDPQLARETALKLAPEPV